MSHSSQTCFGLLIINKAGGLIYHRNYAEGLSQLSSNDYLVLASTFHSIHAIASRLSPIPSSSGVETVEADTFKMTCLQTPTGIKFLLLTTPSHPSPLTVLQNVYRVYANHLKDPFYTVEMPIARSDAFDAQMTAVCRGSGPTGAGGGGGGAIGSGSGLSLVGSLGAGAGVGGGGGGGSSSSTVNS